MINPLCGRWRRELARHAALGEALPAGSRLAHHVTRCESCRAVWNGLRHLTADLSRALAAPTTSASFNERLWARIGAAQQPSGGRGSAAAGPWRWLLALSPAAPAVLAAALAVILLAGLTLARHARAPASRPHRQLIVHQAHPRPIRRDSPRTHHQPFKPVPTELGQESMRQSDRGRGFAGVPTPVGFGGASERSRRRKADSRPHSSRPTGTGASSQPPPAVPVRDDLAYLNDDPLQTVRRWAPRSDVETWDALAGWLRRSVRQRDDFIRIPFPRLVAAAPRQIAEAVESYKREAAVVDTRLFQHVTLQQKAVSFDDFCRELARQTGIRIEAGRGVADERVTALVKERPLREVMRQVSRLFGFSWLRSGKAGEYRYELVQDLKSQLLEEELRSRDLNEALLAMDHEMQALRPYVGLTPEALRAKAEVAPTSELKQQLQQLARGGWGAAQMYFRLSPEEALALRSGQELRYGSEPEAKQRPLPDDLRLSVLEKLSDARVWRKGNSIGVGSASGVPAGAEQYELKALPDVRVGVTLRASRSELGQIGLEGYSSYFWRSEGASVSGRSGGSLAIGVSPSVASPNNARANTELARDPALRVLVSWRAESSCRCGDDYPRFPLQGQSVAGSQAGSTAAAPEPLVSTADVLAAVHRATGIDILSDTYTRLYPQPAVSVEKSRLFDALNRVSDAMRYRWRKEDSFLLFRSASYFNDKLKEVPNRLLERWARSVREHGRPSLDDLIEIAQLRDAQLDSERVADGAVHCYGIKGWGLARSPNLRPHLRFLALLDPEQRRLAQSPTGTPFRQMNNQQQQQFLAVGFGGTDSPILPEALLTAAVRVDLPPPGAFEWVPRDAAHEFAPERRVRAATPEQVLAAARRLQSSVTAADIQPTTADLKVEYSLGPTPDGVIQRAGFGAWSGWRRGKNPSAPLPARTDP